MNRRDRALKALYIEEPDMIPITELWIDVPHIEALTGKALTGEFSKDTLVSVTEE